MNTALRVAAVDMGAESSRVARVDFDGTALDIDVVERCTNVSRAVDGVLRWDVNNLWNSVKRGLGILAEDSAPVSAVGVDTWGCDFGLFDSAGELIVDPSCYRDRRNSGYMAIAEERVGIEALYTATGTQQLAINGLFTLMAHAAEERERLQRARSLQLMPDLFHRFLSGTDVTEFSAASTTGFFSIVENRWATDLLDQLEVPTHFLPEVAPAGTDVGQVLPELAIGSLRSTRVILPAGHDTASAAVAVPFRAESEGFISSGTWSLVGVLNDTPIITDTAMRANLSNEGAWNGRVRLLRNVMGLWLIQQCRAQWRSEGTPIDYAQLAEATSEVEPLRFLINPFAEDFVAPGDMPNRIRAYCAQRGLPVPESMLEIARCVVDSLALGYREVFADIAEVRGRTIDAVNVVGGGTGHRLLQQATADAMGMPVRCGSAEATALGNAAVQLVGLGEISAEQIPELIANSSDVVEYAPRNTERWLEGAARMRKLVDSDAQNFGSMVNHGTHQRMNGGER